MQIIKLSNVKSFSSKIALNKIDLEFKSNRINGLLGPMEVEKQLCLRSSRFLNPDKGEVLLDGENLVEKNLH